ncbi:hypothetical protein [Pseudoalteromonas mariniglutinosa]|uniref:hypothetical protein n=1 Tax=Pseudoalteromonas mariniglutinosa TaxID=206042 RepID=UPI003851548E
MSNVSTCITYDASTSLILVTLKGTASAQDVINFYKIAQHYSVLYNSNRILVDVSQVTHQFPATDLLNIMPTIASWLKQTAIARVVSFDGFMNDLFVQKAKRFNLNTENFESVQTAKNWLLEQPSF